jgi:hypothetical protein
MLLGAAALVQHDRSSSGIVSTSNLDIWPQARFNLRLGAVRRLANEASDCGPLSSDLAAGIRRVKGVKKIGVRPGNWLTTDQSQRLWNTPDPQLLKGKRDRARPRQWPSAARSGEFGFRSRPAARGALGDH